MIQGGFVSLSQMIGAWLAPYSAYSTVTPALLAEVSTIDEKLAKLGLDRPKTDWPAVTWRNTVMYIRTKESVHKQLTRTLRAREKSVVCDNITVNVPFSFSPNIPLSDRGSLLA